MSTQPDPTAAAVRAAQAEALRAARDDIKARIDTFNRLNADPQYIAALDDAWGLVSNRMRAADRLACCDDTSQESASEVSDAHTDTAAPEGEGRPCDNNEACPNCTTAYVECADGNCIACDDAYAAPVAVEGVETVQWGLMRGAQLVYGPTTSAEWNGTTTLNEAAERWYPDAVVVRRTVTTYPDRVSEWSPVEPETSEPEGGDPGCAACGEPRHGDHALCRSCMEDSGIPVEPEGGESRG